MSQESKVDIRSQLVPLEPLDLKQCQTVGQLVRAMSKCSFGARMLGEVAEALYRWTICPTSKHRPGVLFAGPRLKDLFSRFFHAHNWSISALEYFERYYTSNGQTLIIGRFGEERERVIHSLTEAIFINREGLCRPGQVRDGYFPNAVFEDPCLVVPVIAAALDEWLRIKTWTVTELFATLPQYGGLAAEVVRGAEVLKAMVDDPDCTVIMTASGAMTVAQLDYLFSDMIEEGMIHCLVTTGALMGHGLVKGAGRRQFKYDPRWSDRDLGEQGLNRVTDTLEPEENFDHIDGIINRILASTEFDVGGEVMISPSQLLRAVGKFLSNNYLEERGVLKSAYRHGVPVCVPAFNDSELGNDLFCHNHQRVRSGRGKLVMDMERDGALLVDVALQAKHLGIFSIGGGVPGNHARNVAPLIDLLGKRCDLLDRPTRKYSYSCKICPDPIWLGHFSGCAGSEMISWNKAWPDAMLGDVHADATIAWPLILKWVMENCRR